jgi:hypothetical protein
MARTDIKKEIQKVINSFPEDVLEDILDYLKELKIHSEESTIDYQFLRKIILEDKELLKRLAQ